MTKYLLKRTLSITEIDDFNKEKIYDDTDLWTLRFNHLRTVCRDSDGLIMTLGEFLDALAENQRKLEWVKQEFLSLARDLKGNSEGRNTGGQRARENFSIKENHK